MTRLIISALLILVLPNASLGQQGPMRVPGPDVGTDVGFDEFDGPTDIDYSYANLLSCMSMNSITGPIFFPQCFSDKTEEDNTREETKALDRIVRAGALAIGSIAAGIEYVKDIIQSGRDLFHAVEAIVHAFDMKTPEQTVFRLAMATDRFNYQLEAAEEVSLHYQLPTPNERHTMIQTLAIRALALAADANEAAVSLSDQAAGMQMRLDDDGRIEVNALFGGSGEVASRTDLPPLPSDAPASAGTFYAQRVASAPAGVASYSAEVNGPQLAAMARAADASGDQAEDAVCVFDDDMSEDPAVVYQRVMVMAGGAQTAATPTLANITEERDMLTAVRMREIQMDRERAVRTLLSSLAAM